MVSPSRVQFERLVGTGVAPTSGLPGSFAVNLTDRKLWVFDLGGGPVLAANPIMDFDPGRAYAAGDIVVAGSSLWLADGLIGPGSFNPALWTALDGREGAKALEPTGSGIITSGGVLSAPGGATVAYTGGAGWLTGSSGPVRVEWPAGTANLVAGGEAMRVVAVAPSGLVLSYPMGQVPARARDHIILGFATFDANGDIADVWNAPDVARGAAGDVRDMARALGGAFIVSGGVLESPGGLGLSLSAGVSFAPGWQWRSNAANPNFVTIAGGPLVFDVLGPDGAVIDTAASDVPAQVYAGGALTAGFSTAHFIFTDPSGARPRLQLGAAIYPSAREAAVALPKDWLSFAAVLQPSPAAMLVGAAVITSGVAEIETVIPVRPGPRTGLIFDQVAMGSGFLRVDGSNTMAGPLDMAGQPLLNATVDEGTF